MKGIPWILPSGWRISFVVKHLPIDRFDIVVAREEDGNKDIVKRVIRNAW